MVLFCVFTSPIIKGTFAWLYDCRLEVGCSCGELYGGRGNKLLRYQDRYIDGWINE